ncbi:putative metalloprotease [Nakamurella sp. UYEF19]|uniref:hypothetical protein n=1 Tax=Nakamurella sp. UYEF19 TaxID=1756392 RepID=UPI00339408BD
MPRRATRLVVALLCTLLIVGIAVAALATEQVTGSPLPVETIVVSGGGAGTAALPTIRHVGAPSAMSTHDDEAVAGVLADLDTFWAAALPGEFDRPFVPLAGGYVSIDSTAATGTSYCISSPDQIAGNAYYCPTGDAIVYDSAGLVPVLLGHYGVAGLTAAFAHEFGHAIQARIGPTPAERSAQPERYPSILIEAQGDCFSGAFLAWTAAGKSAHVRLPASSMVRAVAPLLDFSDPVSVKADDSTAHGLSLDRLTAVLRGYRGGVTACHALTATDLRPTLGRPGLVTTTQPDRFASVDAAIGAARPSIGRFTATLPTTATVTGLASAAPSAGDLRAAAPYGQFADAAALAFAVGRSITGSSAGAACFTGAWTASVFGRTTAGQLGSWAGDADEALSMLRARPDATLPELAAYADGFTTGWSTCH